MTSKHTHTVQYPYVLEWSMLIISDKRIVDILSSVSATMCTLYVKNLLHFINVNVRTSASLPFFLSTDHLHTYSQSFLFFFLLHFFFFHSIRMCIVNVHAKLYVRVQKCAYSYYNNLYSSGKNIAKVLLKAKIRKKKTRKRKINM